MAEEKGILILGAAGFIGTNLSLRLLEEHKKLLLFDRPDAVYPKKLMDAAYEGRAEMISGRFSADTFYGGASDADRKNGCGTVLTARRRDEIGPRLSEADCVYHLISTTCPTNSNRDVAAEMEENLIPTVRLLDACVDAGVKRIVFLSSGGTVYGREHTGVCREDQEAFPITSYGVQKLAIEKMLYLYHEMHGLDYRIIRLSNPYGPWQRPNGVQGVVTTFTWRALKGMPIEVYGDGSVVRDYIYIADAVEGILKIADGSGKHRLYNLGRGEGRTVMDVIASVEKVLGKRPQVVYRPGRPVDVPVNVLDISRFKAEYGTFNPIPLTEGIRRTAAFLKSQEEMT